MPALYSIQDIQELSEVLTNQDLCEAITAIFFTRFKSRRAAPAATSSLHLWYAVALYCLDKLQYWVCDICDDTLIVS